MAPALLDQLHDIEELDPIGWWPLAPGWWIVMGLAIVVILILLAYIISWILFSRSWKKDTLNQLALLEHRLSDKTAREVLTHVSEYLRRIVLRRFSRQDCAALTGENWLKWLADHDPKKFDWESKGKILLELPYAPWNSALPASQVREIIRATKQWVR